MRPIRVFILFQANTVCKGHTNWSYRHHMDKAPKWVCTCVNLFDIGRTDFQSLLQLFCGGQLFPLVICVLWSVAKLPFWGHVIHIACLSTCGCLGSPLGRGWVVIARSSPGAGYGHPGHVSWVTAKPHGGSPCSVSYSTYLCTFSIHMSMYWPPFIPSVQRRPLLFFVLFA